MDTGYIYALTNPSMPGLIKLGQTKKEIGPEARAAQLFTTGVPTPFTVAGSWPMDHHAVRERIAHERLKDYRVNPRREFFTAELELIAKTVEDVLKIEITKELEVEYADKPEEITKEFMEFIFNKVATLLNIHENPTWTEVEWAALVAKFSAITEWTDLPAESEIKSSSLWECMNVAFKLRHRYGDGEHRSPAIHLRNDLNQVLSRSGMQLKSRKVGAPEQVREGLDGRDLKAEHEAFAAAHRAELSADASFSPTKLKEGVRPKNRQPAADWEEGASPTTRAIAIQARIDELWAAEKARLGVGEAKFHQPVEFFIAQV